MWSEVRFIVISERSQLFENEHAVRGMTTNNTHAGWRIFLMATMVSNG